MSIRNFCAIWISLHDGQCSKQAMDVDDKHMQNARKGPRAELKISSGAEEQFWQEKQKMVTCEKTEVYHIVID